MPPAPEASGVPGSTQTPTVGALRVREQLLSDPTMRSPRDILTDFLAAPPSSTPTEVLDLLQGLVGPETPVLPHHLYTEAVEQSPVAISITDTRATILYVNRAFETLTGYTRDQVLGENESILSSRATPSAVYRQLWRTIQSRRTWSGDVINRTRGGVDYIASLTVSPVIDGHGRIAYFLAIHRDVSREHELESQLRKQKHRVETVLDSAPVAMVLMDESGRVLLDNHEYKKMLGDLRGQEPIEVLRAALKGQAGIDVTGEAAWTDGFADVEVSVEFPGRQGPRWYACSGSRVAETDDRVQNFFGGLGATEKNRLLFLANDITARKQEVERAFLESLRARMAEQQRDHGLREALDAAMYQLQGPLNLIQAAVGMLQGGRTDPAILLDGLHQISASTRQTFEALRAALPRDEEATYNFTNINELIRQVLELETDRLLSTGVVVDWRPVPVLPEVFGSKDQLRRLFMHVIENAIVALEECNRTHRELRVATTTHDDVVEVVVQDNADGIASENQLSVFEPFFIGWRNRRGHAGMGLALSQEIVNAHEGSIYIDPAFTDGCRVCLAFTCSKD